ncbi:MAG: hypothetical protein ACFFG0_10395 [Candidatus Thorarchaeota archaeon]
METKEKRISKACERLALYLEAKSQGINPEENENWEEDLKKIKGGNQ